MKRYFAFGCSYSDYEWPMLPDLIGVNFDKYYNFASAGACHQFMLMQLIQAHELYQLNPATDYVTIGTTGFGRFAFAQECPTFDETFEWKKHGDIFPEFDQHPPKARLWAREFDSYRYSVYRSLSALKTIKLLLTSMGIKHKIYKAVHNKHQDPEFLQRVTLDEQTTEMVTEFYSLCDTKESVDDYLMDYMRNRGEYYHPWLDGHPTINVSRRFLETYFPEYNTDLVQRVCQENEYAINTTPTRKEYVDNYRENFLRVYRTDYDILNRVKGHPRYVKQT